MSYITYQEYTNLGGICPQASFPPSVIDAEAKIKYLTNGRVEDLDTIPDEVKLFETKIIDILYLKKQNSGSATDASAGTVSSYSNGIESFSFDLSQYSEETLNNKYRQWMKEYLFAYPCLICRKVKCNDWCRYYTE